MCKSFLGPFSGGGLLAGGPACRLDIFLHIPLHHKEGGAAALQKGLVEIQLGKILPQRLLGLTALSSMHACMQFDVYLSDPHYTEKVAICCGDAGN